MKPDAVWIIGGSLLQTWAVRAARDLGLAVVVSDRNPMASCMKRADYALVISTYDAEEHVNRLKTVQQHFNLKGVFTAGANVEYTVARVAEAAKLPGITPLAANNCQDKVQMHKVLGIHAVRTPQWSDAALGWTSLPCIVKPSRQCASRGLSVVSELSQMEAAWKGATNSNLNWYTDYVVEGLIEGDDCSPEVLFDDLGRMYPLHMNDRFFEYNAFGYGDGRKACVEWGHVNPSSLPSVVQDDVYHEVWKAAKALGVEWGVFKCDVIVSDKKPYIIETSARLSGGFHSQETDPLSTGRNITRAALSQACGLPIDPYDLLHKFNRASACWGVYPRRQGTLVSVDLTEAWKVPGIKAIYSYAEIGKEVGLVTSCADRLVYCISQADSTHEALKIARESASRVKLEIQ